MPIGSVWHVARELAGIAEAGGIKDMVRGLAEAPAGPRLLEVRTGRAARLRSGRRFIGADIDQQQVGSQHQTQH